MESRYLAHQQPHGQSSLVRYGNVDGLSRLPLLPFERELIKTIGCTEEEYRRFAAEAYLRSKVRPAGYEHIPDIQNPGVAVVPILINLAVGLVVSGISMLLTPKPRQPKQPGQVSSRQLGSASGADRFSATSGFDTFAELATFGDPIPIIFGQYTGSTGGILAAPRLVWSRAFSYGSQQGVKLLMVVGEQGVSDGIERPDLNGIFLGNAALDSIYAHNFAFYWKRNSNKSTRIKAENLGYGTRGSQSSGDTQTIDDVFVTQTIAGRSQPGFCQVYTPSANVQFGVHSGIPNGTDYRVNFRLIPIPEIPDEDNRSKDDPENQRLFERIKIAGDYGYAGKEAIRDEAQRGVGRGYGRHMGITSLNGVDVNSIDKEVRQVRVGDVAIFTIAPGKLPKNQYWQSSDNQSTQVSDINSETISGRRAADELLLLGETVMIGRTVWVVESRSLPEWTEDQRQSIGLRCIEVFGEGIGASIGVLNEKMVNKDILNDDLGMDNKKDEPVYSAGAGFYPLLRVAFGIVRNSRECEVTEIGIKSQVYNRANGLCNFSGLPSVRSFRKAEQDGVGIESGTMTLYIKRTSVWTIVLRPSGTDENGNEYKWEPLGEQFCVTGESPQDQFNYIRIGHPERGRYEFKMLPKSGADVSRHSPDDAVFWRLDAKTRQELTGRYSTAYGIFELSTVGTIVIKKEIASNPEMFSKFSVENEGGITTVPTGIGVTSYIPDVEDASTVATAVQLETYLPDNVSIGRAGATHHELFGRPLSEGLVETAQRTIVLGSGGRTITVLYTGIADSYYPLTHPYFPGYRSWSIQSIKVVSCSGGFNTGQVIDDVIPVSGDNPRALPYGLTTCGVRLKVTQTNAVFTGGRESGWEHEILGSAEPFALNAKSSARFSVTANTGGTAQVIAEGTVFARPAESQARFPGQTKGWNVTYKVDPLSVSGTWASNSIAEVKRTVSSGNPYLTAGSEVGVVLKVLAVGTAVIPPNFTVDRAFEENSQLNDISLYNSLLTKSNQSGPEHEIVYVNESVSNPTVPEYKNLTLAGLALKASRNFSSLNQLRVWLPNGISVRKFAADAPTPIGPSNKFTDLVYYLLTDKIAGAGNVIAPELIDTSTFAATSQFLKQNKLFFDGAIDRATNIRQFISDLAPFFLCSFVIKNGQFSIIPAVPIDSTGKISTGPIKIKQLFTSGNILEGSFNVEYLSTEERNNFSAVVRYRQERRNQFPEEQTLVVKWADLQSTTTLENFDMTQYCTSREHAFLAAKYFMSLRRRVTHTISFKTTPYGLNLAPGDYIRVITEANVYNAANNGVVSSTGVITAVTPLEDGQYQVFYWNSSFDDPLTEQMTVAGGKAVEEKFFDSIFTLDNSTVSSATYMIEQLTVGEDGLVDIVAADFPTTNTFNSKLALDLLNNSAFVTER